MNSFTKEYLKTVLSSDPVKVNLNDLDQNYQGRLSIKCDAFEFESFLLKTSLNSSKKLYVFLSAVGNIHRSYPLFHRVSWFTFFDGICIAIDDPTRNIVNFAPTFYYGSKQFNLIYDLQRLIEKISAIYNISNNNIYFISSSNGAFASLLLCDKFAFSNCIALNPQFSVRLYFSDDRFINLFDTTWDESFDRLDACKILCSKNSKYFIYCNIACHSDKNQLDYFASTFGFRYKYGLQSIQSNVKLLVANIKGKQPHLYQPDARACLYFESILSSQVRFSDVLACNSIMSYFNEFNKLKDRFILQEE